MKWLWVLLGEISRCFWYQLTCNDYNDAGGTETLFQLMQERNNLFIAWGFSFCSLLKAWVCLLRGGCCLNMLMSWMGKLLALSAYYLWLGSRKPVLRKSLICDASFKGVWNTPEFVILFWEVWRGWDKCCHLQFRWQFVQRWRTISQSHSLTHTCISTISTGVTINRVQISPK